MANSTPPPDQTNENRIVRQLLSAVLVVDAYRERQAEEMLKRIAALEAQLQKKGRHESE